MATNTPVARVAALQGQVFAQDEKGNLRQLKLDDPIYEGEVLVTGMGASVDDLTHSCGLTKAEAELVSRLHQARKA